MFEKHSVIKLTTLSSIKLHTTTYCVRHELFDIAKQTSTSIHRSTLPFSHKTLIHENLFSSYSHSVKHSIISSNNNSSSITNLIVEKLVYPIKIRTWYKVHGMAVNVARTEVNIYTLLLNHIKGLRIDYQASCHFCCISCLDWLLLLFYYAYKYYGYCVN